MDYASNMRLRSPRTIEGLHGQCIVVHDPFRAPAKGMTGRVMQIVQLRAL